MIFEHIDGRKIPVKERTQAQISKVQLRYMRPQEVARYEYVGNQHISRMNGNIYADFIDENGYKHTFYIADYNDYINEILSNNFERKRKIESVYSKKRTERI